jgi:hypothetical protein
MSVEGEENFFVDIMELKREMEFEIVKVGGI